MVIRISLDDELVRSAQRFSKAASEQALIEEALRVFVDVKTAEANSPSYEERVRLLAPRLQGLALSEAPSEILRRDREALMT